MSIGIRKTFNLDMVPGGAPPIIHVSAGDVGRPFRANLLYNGETYDLDTVTSVVVRGTKPDKTVFEYALTFDTEDSHVDFVIEEQMAIIAGQVLCEIRLFSGEDTIGSGNFILDVETAVYDPEAASESYIPSYETAIQEALENVADDIADLATAAAINDVKQYSDAASESATAAAGSATSAAESAANAFSGTPDGYAALVNTVNTLKTNILPTYKNYTILPSTTDLNTHVTPGTYVCTTAAAAGNYQNCPIGQAFRMDVYFAQYGDNKKWCYGWQELKPIGNDNADIIFRRYMATAGTADVWSFGNWLKFPTRAEIDTLKSTIVGTITPASGSDASGDLYAVKIGSWIHVRGYIRFSTAIPASSETEIATISGIDFLHNVRFPCTSGNEAYNATVAGYCIIVASTKSIKVRLSTSSNTVVFCTTFPADY